MVERRASAEAGAFESFGTDRAIALLAALPREQGEVVALRVIAGLDAEHVGQILGKRPGNVRVLQHRALRRLAALLESEDVRSEDVTR
jgi:RNA polymerase sigma-70 factor (ECF subfamily)